MLIGDWFKADKTVLKESAIAQQRLTQALYQAFNDYGQLEIYQDYSVRVYIPRNNYMRIAYPDRGAAITTAERLGLKIRESIGGIYPKL